MKKKTWDRLTPAIQEAQRDRSRSWWTPERRAEAARVGRERWRERNPEKAAMVDRIAAAIASGAINVEPCPDCLGPGRPQPDYVSGGVAISTWRCTACWRAMAIDPTTLPHDEVTP